MNVAVSGLPAMGAAGAWRCRCAAWLLAAVACCVVVPSSAQTLGDVDLRPRGDAFALDIRFNASVRLIQLAPTKAADLYTVRFELLSSEEAVLSQRTDEFRRIPAGGGLPEIRITYAAAPGSRVKQLTVRLGAALLLKPGPAPNLRTLELLVARPALPAAAAPELRRFALTLDTVPLAEKDRVAMIPNALQDLDVITAEKVVDGVPSFEVAVGYFATREQAEAARSAALQRFPHARIVDLAAVQSGAPLNPQAAVPIVAAPPAPADSAAAASGAPAPATAIDTAVARPDAGAPTEAALAQNERQAAELLQQARDALAANRGDDAVAVLNQLLKLPPNGSSMAAQELIGLAWERVGQPDRARLEDELYLKLYPQGEGASRVSKRLVALGGAVAPAAVGAVAPARPAPRAWSGSIAQYYYGGKAKSNSLVNIATGIDQSTISRTSESAVVTSVDMAGRYQGQDSETRFVLRGSGSKNLLSTSHSSSSIGAAYVEYRRRGEGLAVRAGRQSPISGGLLGLFDGVSLAYPVGNGLRLDVMGGVPASPLVSAPSERLFAAVVEADTLFERWGGNVYMLTQSTQGITNRRALGSEIRYAGERWSLNTLLDYDTVFRALNALSAHASFQAGAQTTLTVLADARRAPSLQLTNALISSGAASLSELLQARTLSQVRSDALATSAIARQFLVSVARPLNERWQLATDLQYSAIGALPAVGDFEATPATGAQYSVSAQLTGTNLYSPRDINNFNLSVLHTPFFNGLQLAYNNLTGLDKNHDLTLEPSIRFYTQRDKQDVRLTRVGPGLRLSYRASVRSSLLGELLYEVSRTEGPTNHDNSSSVFFYVGYRYELF